MASLSLSRNKISKISIEILSIFRLSVEVDKISSTDSRLEEISVISSIFQRYIGFFFYVSTIFPILADISATSF